MPGRTWFRSAWFPVACWLLVILGLSSIPDLGTREQKVPWSDKLAHGCEYGVLGVLFARAVTAKRPQTRRAVVRVVAVAALIGLSIGSLDEWYQTLIPGRSSGPGDAAADMIGAALGGAAWASGTLHRVSRNVAHRMGRSMGRRTS